MSEDQTVNTEEIRQEVINILRNAIKKVEESALKGLKRSGGTTLIRTKWFQILGYLSQTINRVMQNGDLEDAKRDIAELRLIIGRLEEGEAKSPPSG